MNQTYRICERGGGCRLLDVGIEVDIGMEAWSTPPAAPHAQHDEIHVWRTRLDVADPILDRRAGLLSEEERARASRFTSTSARKRFIAARAFLREILSFYVGTDPRELSLAFNKWGKPAMAEETDGPAQLRFNVAHTDGLALFAVAWGREVGVDIERLDARIAIHVLPGRFLSPMETAALAALPRPLRARGFFACWVRKEAFLKARGTGLRAPLNGFSVSVEPERPARLLAAESAIELLRWSMTSLPVGPCHEAALVAEGGGWRLKLWDWAALAEPGRVPARERSPL